jgi:uncharacterized membrane protein
MTITTSLSPRYGEKEFSRRPATSKSETILTLASGTALAAYGATRRDWLGAGIAGAGGYLLYRGVTNLRRPYQGRVRVGFTIAKSAQEIYEFVHQPENWNRFLHAIELERPANGRLTLKLGKPAGLDIESRIEITDHSSPDYIAWASDEQFLEHRGVIRFKKAPGNRGTEVSVALEYKAPAGPIARSLASLVGWDPEQMVRESLRHLKQLMEAGEIPTTAGQPVGNRGIRGAAKRVLYREGPAEDATEQVRLAGD